MASNPPIYSIAKEINIESNKIILACKKLGINAKGAAKRLNKQEIEKVKNYFESGKNVSEEIIDLNKVKVNPRINHKIKYFGNRLMGKY